MNYTTRNKIYCNYSDIKKSDETENALISKHLVMLMFLTNRHPKISAVISVWIKIGCDDDSVCKFSTSERLLGFLTINYRIKFNKHLGGKK